MAKWTQQQKDYALRAWNDYDHTAGQIKEVLGEGFTRSAVIGMISRLGGRKKTNGSTQTRRLMPVTRLQRPPLTLLPKPSDRPYRPGRKRKPENVKARKTLEGAPEPLKIDLIERRNHQCRWPYGDGPYYYCGHKRAAGSPYCPFHKKAMVTPSGRNPKKP